MARIDKTRAGRSRRSASAPLSAVSWRRAAVLATMGVVLACSIVGGITQTNVVAGSRSADVSRAATPNDLKPAACAAMTLTDIIAAAGVIRATGSSSLILGSNVDDNIRGRPGADCILGGAGDDTINGGSGADVCIGGPGNDTFTKCETAIQ